MGRKKLGIVTMALVFALAGSAQAASTYCVNAPACTGSSQPSLQAALDMAIAGDRVELGPGSYPGPFSGDDDVTVVGAGRGETVLTAPGAGQTVLTLTGLGGATVWSLSLRADGADATGLSMTGGTVEDVAVDAATGMSFDAALPTPVRVRRARLTAATGIRSSGTLEADDVVVQATAVGVAVASSGLMPGATATLRHVSIVGGATGLAVQSASMMPGMSSPASATLDDSLIAGSATAIRVSAACAPEPCSPSPAHVAVSHSAYAAPVEEPGDAATITFAADSPAPISADPRLDGDQRPRFDSPLIDGAAGAVEVTDASGAARVVDGNGDGAATSDIGALEYQRRAPVITSATATGTAVVGAPIAFSGAATDPDGEPVAATWTYSDGGAAVGFDATHGFAAPGDVTATLTVTDAAGASATRTLGLTVAGGHPPGSNGPRVIARIVPDRLRLGTTGRRDRKAPFRFRLRGRVVLPPGIDTAGCRGGVVRLAVRAGKRRFRRAAKVRGDCAFRYTLDLGRKRAKRVVIRPRFGGTAALTPRDGKALRLRAG